jgi:hypothetical protein
MKRFRLLVRLFHGRFFENDSVAPGSGFETNIYQVVGFLVAAGWFISYFMLPPFLLLSRLPQGPQVMWAVEGLRLFFTTFSFAIVGFAAVFQWDMLFPDRRDFLVLGPFPLRLWEVLAARIVALFSFLLLLVGALNVFPVLMMIVLSALAGGSGLGMVVAQVAATGLASLFAVVAVLLVQGLLIGATTARAYGRISPWVQMVGMSAMVLCVLLYPIYPLLLPSASATGAWWPWLLPPVWFSGAYELVLGGGNEFFRAMGVHGLRVLAGAIGMSCLVWALAYRRQYVQTLEAESVGLIHSRRWPSGLFGSQEERAIVEFGARTLARSGKHRLFLATYLSVGLAIGVLFAIAVRGGRVAISVDGLRAFPFLVVFFAVSGCRAVCQFPAELPANWLFRIPEAGWSEIARRGARKLVFVCALLPVLPMALSIESVEWSWPMVLFHGVFQLAAGALLVEMMFWRFDRVPFTCSYFAGKTNLSLLVGLYLYGFTTYSFNLADLEQAAEVNWVLAVALLLGAAAVLGVCWRRSGRAESVRFDGEEPLIRVLDLT